MKRLNREPTHWIFINLARDFGGHEVMMLRWVEAMEADGIAVTIICFEGSMLEREAGRPGRKVIALGPTRRFGKIGNLLVLFKIIFQLVPRRFAGKNFAVVAEGSLFAQRVGLYASRLSGLFTVMYVPLLESFASMGYPEALKLEREAKAFYVGLADAWVSVSRNQADEFQRWSATSKPIFVLPNTVAPEIECAGLITRQLPIKQPAPMQVLVLGRLDADQKGLDLLLDYLCNAHELNDQFRISFVGAGPFGVTIRAKIDVDPMLAKIISLLPWDKPLETYKKYDALLVPSRYEGVPLVMLEAMAVGLPIVASALPGTSSYLHRSCLFPVGDFHRAFALLDRLARRHNVARRVIARNRLVFQRLGSGDAFARHVRQLTSDLTKEKNGLSA